MARPKSHTLFHFTKSREALERILISGFWPRYCLEDISWLDDDTHKQIAFPMVCFCDIPLSRIDEHVKFYGSFGLGMSKSWAVKNGLNPILYMAAQNSLAKSIIDIDVICQEMSEKCRDKIQENLRRLISHTKPTEGVIVVGGRIVEKEFYQESEWRYTPKSDKIKDHAPSSQFNDETQRNEFNSQAAMHGMLKFLPGDVKYIFVPTDSDIPETINFIQVNMDYLPSADLKVLLSRVISLETVRRDI